MPKASYRYIIILAFLLLLAFDLMSKHYFFDLELYEALRFIEPVCNDGISFSIQVPYSFVKVVSIIFSLIFIYLTIKKKIPGRVGIFLLAGTLGNLYDRMMFECVRDFIIGPYFIFNLADLQLHLGMLGLLYQELRGKK